MDLANCANDGAPVQAERDLVPAETESMIKQAVLAQHPLFVQHGH